MNYSIPKPGLQMSIITCVLLSLVLGFAAPRAKADDQGTAQTTTVKAPLVKVETTGKDGEKNTKVKAPFVKVNTQDGAGAKTNVKAPFVKVESVGGNTKKIRAPFVKIDRVGDKVHIRAPFVNKWKTIDPEAEKKKQMAEDAKEREEKAREAKEEKEDKEKKEKDKDNDD